MTLSWTPSPDEKRDNHLHYMVMKKDSVKQTWRTVVDCLFNNKFTVINILPGREYNFRVFAKNDIGPSEPSVSPVWGTPKIRGLLMSLIKIYIKKIIFLFYGILNYFIIYIYIYIYIKKADVMKYFLNLFLNTTNCFILLQI